MQITVKLIQKKVLISSIVSQLGNLSGKVPQINIFLKKCGMENDVAYVNHDKIKPQQHCNYSGIYLSTVGSKILADNFVLALNTLTWNRIFQENVDLDKDSPETESNSKFLNILSQDTLAGEGKIHVNLENLFFSFLKKTKFKHSENLFLGYYIF